MADALVIEAIDLRKSYAGAEAVRGLNLQVRRGSITGFLGRNGAGKTTTIKMLMGMTRPTGGEIRVFGLSAAGDDASVQIRLRTGFVSDDKSLFDSMTVASIIRFTAAFYPRWRADLEQRYLRKLAQSGVLFTLSLPAARRQWLGVRVATGLAELVVLAFVPSLCMVVLSPTIGQRYSLVDVLVHGACLVLAGAAFFNLALLLSTVFNDLWRPLLIACAVAVLLGLAEPFLFGPSSSGIFGAMTAKVYLLDGALPWPGLAASAAASAAMLYAANASFARQDY